MLVPLGDQKCSDTSAAAHRAVALKAAGAVTAVGTVSEAAKDLIGAFRSAEIQLNVTAAATEAGDTLDVFVDTTYDGGLTWVNLIHFPQALGNGGAKKYVAHVGTANPAAAPVDVTADAAVNVARNLGLGDQLRVRHTLAQAITTGNESFNFSVYALLRT